MKQLSFFLITLTVFFAACTPIHEYTIRGNNLHVFLNKPDAITVYFVSSSNGFRPQKAEKLDAGRWQNITSAGTEFRYFYIIDGLLYIPPCTFKERDDFGGQNCIYVPGM